MIRGVGIDLVEIDRFRKTLERRPSLIERIFTESERQYALQRSDPTERFAARFAAKEAALKSMGVGIGAADWHDLEVLRDEDGKPSLNVTSRAAILAADLGITRFELSITHTDSLAQAEVIALGGAGQRRMSRWRAEGAAGVAAGDSSDSSAWRAPIDPLISGGLVPIVTPAEMRSIDQDAPEPVEELIARAGSALTRHAISMLGGAYGRRVVVLVGSGNNGNDGRDAARRLARRGVRVRIIEVSDLLARRPDADPVQLPACDLVIDAAFGTGFRGVYTAPVAAPGAMVLAVDVPSGIDGLVGVAGGRVLPADETISFAALKPGLLFGAGTVAAGRISVVDIGLDVSRATAHLLGAAAVAGWLPTRSFDAHKWNTAVCIIAGGPGMEGAAALCARAAMRAGAGYVRLSTPGESTMQLPTEVVIRHLEPVHWEQSILPDLGRFRSLVIGNGLGTSPETVASVLNVLAAAKEHALPTVVDADALTALASLGVNDAAAAFLGGHAVLTPHDGEFARLAGAAPGEDRISAARELAQRSGSVVLLKGSATVVAAPDGTVLVSNAGDQRLATAGTGDVLAGIIGALLAQGMDPLRAAAAGAFIHGRAGALGWRSGSVAGDLPWRIPGVREELAALLPQR